MAYILARTGWTLAELNATDFDTVDNVMIVLRAMDEARAEQAEKARKG